jgi:hypothetical protein
VFKEIIAVYSDKDKKAINMLCRQNEALLKVKVGGTYSYHSVLKR